MKSNICFKLSLMFLLLVLVFSVVSAQKKTVKKTSGSNLKNTLALISGKTKSEVTYVDGKENAGCLNQTAKKTVYQEVNFTAASNFEIKLVEEITRSACSKNLINDEKSTSSSVGYDEAKISVPLRQLNSSAITVGSCPLEKEFQRKEGSCFFINLEAVSNLKAFKIEKVSSFKFNEKQVTDKQAVSYATNQFQIFFADEETAQNVAKAFIQAIKLSGGN